MKAIFGVLGATTMFLLSIPMVFANGGSSTAPYACGQLGVILDTIRTLESGGNYEIRNANASAAGAYQYITSTWRHWAEQADVSTDTYPTADTAPPHIQDQVAGVNVSSILADNDNNIETVPVIWYYPTALDNDTIMEVARLHQTPRIVTTSTSETYGSAQYVPIDENHPAVGQSPYAATKIGADQFALSYHRSFELPVWVVRPFNTYGPRQSARAIIPTVISQIISGQRVLQLGNVEPTRDLTFVKDTAAGFLSIAECDQAR